MRRRTEVLVGLALLAAVPLQTILSLTLKSATFDEPIHLAQGIRNLETGDWTIPYEHPPLARILAAASLYALDAPVVYAEPIAWSPFLLTREAQALLYLDNDADRLLFWARVSLLPLYLALALGVWGVARKLWGPAGGLGALTLCAFSPTLLAHGRLVTADLPVTVFLFLGIAAVWWAAVEGITILRLVLAGLFLGAALLVKHSALLGLPVALATLSLRALRSEPWEMGLLRRRLRLVTRPARAFGGLVAWTFVLAVCLLTVWGFFGFRHDAVQIEGPEREARQALVARYRTQAELEEDSVGGWLMDAADGFRILPEPYLLGVRNTLAHMRYRLTYFMGERAIEGTPWYFPVAFAVKTPLGTQLLLLLAAIGWARGRLPAPSWRLGYLLVFPAAYFLQAVASNLNLGQRHILPVYPFLFVLAAGCVPMALHGSRATLPSGRGRMIFPGRWPMTLRKWPLTALRERCRVALTGRQPAASSEGRRQDARRAGWEKVLVGGAIAWVAASCLWIYPDYLAYFNELAGGPAGGSRFLGDSNLDWGQDLKRLPAWMEEHGIPHVKLGYFGTALPQYYGFSFEYLPSVGYFNDQSGTRTVREGDVLAVSVTCLQGFYFQDMETYRFLDAFEPIDHIGYSIYLYRIAPERRR